MTINIIQGVTSPPPSDINIIIDVIRAFTVSFYAYENGIKEIILISDEHEALALKNHHSDYLLSGEIGGYKIDGFDFGNSPQEISTANIADKTLVQRTTNGVKVTLNSLEAEHVLVTGFVNAYETSLWVQKLVKDTYDNNAIINIIASHPNGDDDLSCAQYMKNLILNEYHDIQTLQEETATRIIHSAAAEKFLDPCNTDFSVLDLIKCLTLQKSNFIMQIIHDGNHTKIVKRLINA